MPGTWTYDELNSNDGVQCDCNCGVRDPDCANETLVAVGCGSGEICGGTRLCETVCTPSCDGKVCGNNGCGGGCGDCLDPTPFCNSCTCGAACVGGCDARVCGQDDCGVSCGGGCGSCASGERCSATQVCVADPCSPDPCSGNGLRGIDSGACTCATGYDGLNCQVCASGYAGYPTCAPSLCDVTSCDLGLIDVRITSLLVGTHGTRKLFWPDRASQKALWDSNVVNPACSVYVTGHTCVRRSNWVEHQNNTKQTGGAPLAAEIGRNWYMRVADQECAEVKRWAEPRLAYWQLLRTEWAHEFAKSEAQDEPLVAGRAPRFVKLSAIEDELHLLVQNDETARQEARRRIREVIAEYQKR